MLDPKKVYFIFFNNKIFKLYLDKNKTTRIKEKEPTETTTNEICFLLHHNKESKKSGYFVFNIDDEIDEDLIRAEAAKKLNLIDSGMVHLMKITNGNYQIFYYISKLEIERLFVEYEFSKIYPFELFMYFSDMTAELYGIISEDIFYMKQINKIKDLTTSNKTFFQTEILSFQENLTYLFNVKAKKIIYNGSMDDLIEIHDTLNRSENNLDYIPYKNRNDEEKNIVDPYPFVTNLSLIEFKDLKNLLKRDDLNKFCFEDKFSTYYKAKQLKPIMLILSVVFLVLFIYFSYQFINTQTINYIYSNKISNLKQEIKKFEKKNKDALSQNYLIYYKPLNINLLKETIKIIALLDTSTIKNYKLNIVKNNVNVSIESSSLKNVEIMNNIKNKIPNLYNVNYSNKNKTTYLITFNYGKKNSKKHIRRK